MADNATLKIGETVTSASKRLTREAAIGFAKEFDPQPMHLDDTAAAVGFFGTLAASGWHGASWKIGQYRLNNWEQYDGSK